MADVFLSYSRVDREKAQTIAQALEAEGLSVWWDKILHAGQTYDEVTENMLRDSKVCVVLWSAVSVKSKWVRAEATLGERSSAVVPAMLEEAERPIMFELTQTADLIGWDGDRSEERWKTFVADIRLALGPVDDAVEVEATPAPAPAPAPALAPDLDATIETTFWTSIKDGSDPADFEAYLKRYPEGHYSDLARNRLSALATSAVEPEPAPILATPPPEIAAPVSPPVPTASASKTKPSPVLLGAGAVGLLALILVGFGLTGGFGGGNSEATEDVESSVTASQSGTFKDCETCPELIILPAGDFMMGSPTSEAGRAAYEGPRHEVTLPAFAIGRTEVTFEQWDTCVTAGGCMGYTPGDRGFGRGSQPALGISWNDATAYVQWLSATTGRSYRLPSEAEWEYAARGGTDTAYWWGAGFDRSILPSGAPRDVSMLTANPFGLSGMLGNVKEWVEDCYVNSYANASTNGAPVRSGNCSRRVVRGGSWSSAPAQSRAANRGRISVDIRDGSIGLRIATSELPTE